MRTPVTFHPINGPNHIYLESYKEWLTQKAVTPNTLRAYHSRIKQFLLFVEYANLNEQPLEDLNSLHEAMTMYLKFLKQSKGAAKSVNANINALNNFSHFLGLKSTQLKRERCYHKPAKVLSHAEQNQFLKAIERQEAVRDRALALVLLSTGLRIGDCARLNVEDVLLDNQSAHNKAGDHKAGDKKTSAAQAKSKDNEHKSEHKSHSHGVVACIHLNDGARIPLNKTATVALRQWLAERAQLAPAKTEHALWLTKSLERLTISGITFVIKRIGWQAQLVVSAETLRRTWLVNATEHFDKKELASRFGNYISSATIHRHGLALPVEVGSHLEH